MTINCISLILENMDDSTYLFLMDSDMHLFLPSMKSNENSWSSTANCLLNQIVGGTVKNVKQYFLFKVWCGEEWEYNYNSVLSIMLTKEQVQNHRRYFEGATVIWKNLAEISKAEFVSPEIGVFFCSSSLEMERKFKIFDSAAMVMGNLIEVTKELEMVGQQVKDVYDLLVIETWNNQEQVLIIQGFNVITSPYIFMGLNIFKKLMFKAEISEELAINLFRAADVNNRGALSCREFLCIIAFLEPVERSHLSCIEAEARYVFRVFNKRKNGVWNNTEMEYFFTEIRKKFKATPVLEKDLTKFYKDSDLPLGIDVSLLQFIKAVTSSKFKLPNGFLKSSYKFIHVFQQAKIELRMRGNSKIGYPINDSIEKAKKVLGKENEEGQANKYQIGFHVVKINVNGCREFVGMDNFKPCLSHTSLEKTFPWKQHSCMMFSEETIHNEIIMGLKFFAHNVAPNGKAKEMFTWDKLISDRLGELIINMCNQVIEKLKLEPRLLRLAPPVYTFGDLHGNFIDLWLFENALWPSGLDVLSGSLLFLGDYVDRGQHGIEVVAYLFAHKLKNPKRIYLVRGNHEIRQVQKQFTFYNECLKKFGKELGHDVWKAVNNAFDYLPLAAVVDDSIFCCHGGVPPPWLCPNISVIDNIPMPLSLPDSQSPLSWELLWNDPVRECWLNDSLRTEIAMNEGFAVNKRRGTAHVFSAEALEKFHRINKLVLTVRAHEVMDCGFKLMQNGKLATVFSSSYYTGMTNKAACFMMQDSKVRVISLVTDDYHNKSS